MTECESNPEPLTSQSVSLTIKPWSSCATLLLRHAKHCWYPYIWCVKHDFQIVHGRDMF